MPGGAFLWWTSVFHARGGRCFNCRRSVVALLSAASAAPAWQAAHRTLWHTAYSRIVRSWHARPLRQPSPSWQARFNVLIPAKTVLMPVEGAPHGLPPSIAASLPERFQAIMDECACGEALTLRVGGARDNRHEPCGEAAQDLGFRGGSSWSVCAAASLPTGSTLRRWSARHGISDFVLVLDAADPNVDKRRIEVDPLELLYRKAIGSPGLRPGQQLILSALDESSAWGRK